MAWKRILTFLIVTYAATAGLIAVTRGADSGASAKQEITFSKDVAPILYRHCVECHRPRDIAPFSVLTYQASEPGRHRNNIQLGGDRSERRQC